MTQSCGTMKERLGNLLEKSGNEKCAECDRKNNRPTWVSFFTCPVDRRKLAVLVCPRCHHLHKRVAEGEFVIKGLREVDDFTEDDLEAIELSGNQLVNACYEAGVTTEKDGRDRRKYGYEAFFFEKFVNLRFFSADLYTQLMNESIKSHVGPQSDNDEALESVAVLPVETMNTKEEEKKVSGEDMTRENKEQARKEHEAGKRPDNNESGTFSNESSSNEAPAMAHQNNKSREKCDKQRDHNHRSSSSDKNCRRSSRDHHKNRSSSRHSNHQDDHQSCKSSRSLRKEDSPAEESRHYKRSSSSHKHKSPKRDSLERGRSHRKVNSSNSSKNDQANVSPRRVSSSSRKAHDRKSLERTPSFERHSNSSRGDLMAVPSDSNHHKCSSSPHRDRTPKHEGLRKTSSRRISSNSSKGDLALDDDSSDEDRKHRKHEDHKRSHSLKRTSTSDHLQKDGREKSRDGANSHAERRKAMLKDGRRCDLSPCRVNRSCATDGASRLLRKSSQKDELDRLSSHEMRRPSSKRSFSSQKQGSGERSSSSKRDLLQQNKPSSSSLRSVLVKPSSKHDLSVFRVRSASCRDFMLSDESDLGGQESARIMQMYSKSTEHAHSPLMSPLHGSFSSIHNVAPAKCVVIDRRVFLSKAASERSMSNQIQKRTLCRRTGSARDLLDTRRAEILGLSWDDPPERVDSSKDGDARYGDGLQEENADDHHVSTSNQQGGPHTRRIPAAQASAFSTPSRWRLHGSYNSLRQLQNRQIAHATALTPPRLASPRQGSFGSLMMDDTLLVDSAQTKIQNSSHHRSLSENFLSSPSTPGPVSRQGSSTATSITTSPDCVQDFPEGPETLDIGCGSVGRECLDRKDYWKSRLCAGDSIGIISKENRLERRSKLHASLSAIEY